MKQLLFQRDLTPGEIVEITGTQFHHLCCVRRLGVDDSFPARAASGDVYTARIVTVTGDRCSVRVVARDHGEDACGEPARAVRLFCAPLKGRKTDSIVRQATEVGVSTIGVVHTERTVARIDGDKVESRLRRWNAIAREAVEQCGRPSVPEILAPIDFAELLVRHPPGILLHEAGDAAGALPVHRDKREAPLVVAVGPEGGFSDREVPAARDAGWNIVTLPLPVLRAETAAIVAAALAVLDANQYSIGLPEKTS